MHATVQWILASATSAEHKSLKNIHSQKRKQNNSLASGTRRKNGSVIFIITTFAKSRHFLMFIHSRCTNWTVICFVRYNLPFTRWAALNCTVERADFAPITRIIWNQCHNYSIPTKVESIFRANHHSATVHLFQTVNHMNDTDNRALHCKRQQPHGPASATLCIFS